MSVHLCVWVDTCAYWDLGGLVVRQPIVSLLVRLLPRRRRANFATRSCQWLLTRRSCISYTHSTDSFGHISGDLFTLEESVMIQNPVSVNNKPNLFHPSSLDRRSMEFIVFPKKVVRCRGGNQNSEGWWGFPYLKIKKFVGFTTFPFHVLIDIKFISKILRFYLCMFDHLPIPISVKYN